MDCKVPLIHVPSKSDSVRVPNCRPLETQNATIKNFRFTSGHFAQIIEHTGKPVLINCALYPVDSQNPLMTFQVKFLAIYPPLLE